MVEVRVLGRFAVRREDEEVPQAAFRGRLVRKLIRILATRRGRFVSRDALAEALWPAGLPADPVNSLNVLVARARQALGDPALIATGPGGYSFAGGDACVVDAEVFLEGTRLGLAELAAGRPGPALRQLGQALDAWGEPLAEDAYDDWAADVRNRLTRAHHEALEAAASAALAAGDAVRSAAFAEEAAAAEPLRESSHVLLARALAACGDVAGGLKVLDAFRRRIADELGLDPSPDLEETEVRLLRNEPAPAAVRAPSALPPRSFDDLPFAGRSAEMGTILGLLESGSGGIVVVSGAPGAGKSRLLAEMAARAAVPLVTARSYLPEQEEAWALGRALLRSALALDPSAARSVPDRAAQALADILPELEELRPIGTAPLDPATRRALALEGGVRLVETAVGGRGGVAVDDLQWADPTSVAFLRMLATRLAGTALVLALRAGPASATHASVLLDELAGRERGIVRVELGPLSRDEVRSIVDDDEVAAVVVGETDGSPLAVAEVTRALVRRGLLERAPGGRWRPGAEGTAEQARKEARAGKRRAVEQRVAAEPPRRRKVLTLLALAERELPARVLAAALGTPQAPVLEDLDALASSGLVRLGEQGWAAAHDLITEAVAAALEPPARARMHGLLAEALESQGADLRERARHLAGSGDAAAAAEALAAAAQHSLAAFATAEAAALADEGLALGPTPACRSSLLEVRAEARARLGDIAGAREDLREALERTGRGAARSRVLARMALLVSGSEDLAHAAELAELAVVEAGGDPVARPGALAVGAVVDMNRGLHARARERFDEALALYSEAGDARGVAGILDARAMETFMAGRIAEGARSFDTVARLFVDSGDLLRVITPRSTCGHALVFMGRPEEGLRHIEEALELARSLGYPEGESFALWHRAEAMAALGRGAEAVEAAEAAAAIAERLGHREWTAASLRAVGIAWKAAGEASRAESAFRRSFDTARSVPLFRSWAASQLALVLLERGALDEAERFVEEAAAGPGLSSYEWRLARAEVAAAKGEGRAGSLAAEALALAEENGFLAGTRRLADLARGSAG